MTKKKKPYGTVLIKASKILDVLAGSPNQLGLKEISDLTEITMSTASKILDTLEQIGYVRRDDGRKYSLGGKMIHLASASFIQFDIVRESYPALKFLYNRLNETVHLGMQQNDKVLYINKMSPLSDGKQMVSRIGQTLDLYCSAMGKAMLASFNRLNQQRYLENTNLSPKTTKTIVEKKELTKQLGQIKRKGYAVDDRESEEGVYCIGTIIEPSTELDELYAFSVSIPYEKISSQYKEEVISEVLKAKNVIEFQLETTNI